MEWDDYLRQQAATYRQLAEKAEDAVVKKELLDLADERCRLHGGANGSGAPPGEHNGRLRHGERTKAAIAEQQRKFSA